MSSHERSRFIRETAAIVISMAVGLVVAAWSWLWSVFPVNDGIAFDMTDADWLRATALSAATTAIWASVVFFVLWAINGRLLRPLGPEARRLSLVFAAVAAGLVLLAGWVGAVMFLRGRPIL